MSLFNRTHIYTVHVKPAAGNKPQDIVFVREGFNIWAFVFTVLWALYHRTWLFAAVCLAWGLVLGMISREQIFHSVSFGLLQVGISAIFGYMANDELRENLKKRGYTQEFVATGDNLIKAEQRFFDRHASLLDAA